jgi:hypothetical protein
MGHLLNRWPHRDEDSPPLFSTDVEQPGWTDTDPGPKADWVTAHGCQMAGLLLDDHGGMRRQQDSPGRAARFGGRPHGDYLVPGQRDHQARVLGDDIREHREDVVQCFSDALRSVRTPLDDVLDDRGGLGDVEPQNGQVAGFDD